MIFAQKCRLIEREGIVVVPAGDETKGAEHDFSFAIDPRPGRGKGAKGRKEERRAADASDNRVFAAAERDRGTADGKIKGREREKDRVDEDGSLKGSRDILPVLKGNERCPEFTHSAGVTGSWAIGQTKLARPYLPRSPRSVALPP